MSGAALRPAAAGRNDAPTNYTYKRSAVTGEKPGDVDVKQNKLDWAKKEKLDRDDSQRRLDRLEEKLKKIDDLLNELRENKTKDGRSEKKIEYNNGPN